MVKFKKISLIFAGHRSKVISFVLSFLFLLSAMTAISNNAYIVRISVDGIVHKITTLARDAYQILTQADIDVKKDDVVDLSQFSSGTESTINVYKAHDVIICDAGAETTKVGNGTVALTLENNNIKLNEHDELNYNKNEAICDNMKIEIFRAFPVTIVVNKNPIQIDIARGTVEDALKKANITLGDGDSISAELNAPLTENTTINIINTKYSERTVNEIIPFKTIKQQNADLPLGETKIFIKGVNGEKIITYKDRYADGELVESVVINSTINKNAVNQVELIGTKIINNPIPEQFDIIGTLANSIKTISALNAPDNLQLNGLEPTSYKQKITGIASAYSGGGRTATGKGVMPGYVAVNPKQIPYHSKLWIVSNDGKFIYGYASAEDTGGFVKWTGNRATVCDLYFSSNSEACKFGRRDVTIYIL